MEEARRLAYLSALGIDSYVSRQPLPGAKPSVLPAPLPGATREAATAEQASTVILSEPAGGERPGASRPNRVAVTSFTEVAAAPGDRLPARAVTPRQSPESQHRAPEQPGRENAAQPPDATAGIVEEGRAAEVADLRFSLKFYPVSESFAVISEIPHSQVTRNRQKADALLVAVLRALNFDLRDLPAGERFNWPLTADDDASDIRAGEACQALAGFMRKRLEKNSYRLLLVFAAQLRTLFEDAHLAELLASREILVIYTQSLDAMLQVPSLKKSVWQDIRDIPALLSA